MCFWGYSVQQTSVFYSFMLSYLICWQLWYKIATTLKDRKQFLHGHAWKENIIQYLFYQEMCKSKLYSLDESTDMQPTNFRLFIGICILNVDYNLTKPINI